MKKRILPVAVVALLGLLAYVWLGFGKPEPTTQVVRIGYQPTVFYSYLFLAQDEGYFTDANLDAQLTRIPSANEMIQAFLAGQLDMTGLTATEIVLRAQETAPDTFDLPLLVKLGPENVANRILVLNDSPITSVAQLAGKTVGSHPGTTVPNVLREVLQQAGVDPAGVKIQNLAPDLQVESTLSGAVDAIICLEPCGTELLASGKVRSLLDHPFGAAVQQFPASFATLSREFSAQHPDAAVRLTGVIRRAVEEYRRRILQDRSSLDQLIQKHLGTRPEIASQLKPVDYLLPEEWDQGALTAVVDFYQRFGVAKAPVDLGSLAFPRREGR